MPFITSKYVRRDLQARGINPDDPVIANLLASRGEWIGRQPEEGLSGDVKSFFQGFGRGIANAGLGLLDLVPMAGRAIGATEARIEPLQPSFTEQANPIASGLGGFASFIPQMLVPEAGIAAAGRFIPSLGRGLGALKTGAQLAAVERAYPAARMIGRGLPTGERIAAIARPVTAGGMGADVADLAAQAAYRLGPMRGGFTLPEISQRAIHMGTVMGGVGFMQPGDIGDRLAALAQGSAMGAIFGAVASPPGMGRLATMAREAAGGALAGAVTGAPPVEGLGEGPVPAILGQALMGAALGGITARPFRDFTPRTSAEARAQALGTAPPATAGQPHRPSADMTKMPQEINPGRRAEIARLLGLVDSETAALDRLLAMRDAGEITDPETLALLDKLHPKAPETVPDPGIQAQKAKDSPPPEPSPAVATAAGVARFTAETPALPGLAEPGAFQQTPLAPAPTPGAPPPREIFSVQNGFARVTFGEPSVQIAAESAIDAARAGRPMPTPAEIAQAAERVRSLAEQLPAGLVDATGNLTVEFRIVPYLKEGLATDRNSPHPLILIDARHATELDARVLQDFMAHDLFHNVVSRNVVPERLASFFEESGWERIAPGTPHPETEALRGRRDIQTREHARRVGGGEVVVRVFSNRQTNANELGVVYFRMDGVADRPVFRQVLRQGELLDALAADMDLRSRGGRYDPPTTLHGYMRERQVYSLVDPINEFPSVAIEQYLSNPAAFFEADARTAAAVFRLLDEIDTARAGTSRSPLLAMEMRGQLRLPFNSSRIVVRVSDMPPSEPLALSGARDIPESRPARTFISRIKQEGKVFIQEIVEVGSGKILASAKFDLDNPVLPDLQNKGVVLHPDVEKMRGDAFAKVTAAAQEQLIERLMVTEMNETTGALKFEKRETPNLGEQEVAIDIPLPKAKKPSKAARVAEAKETLAQATAGAGKPVYMPPARTVGAYSMESLALGDTVTLATTGQKGKVLFYHMSSRGTSPEGATLTARYPVVQAENGDLFLLRGVDNYTKTIEDPLTLDQLTTMRIEGMERMIRGGARAYGKSLGLSDAAADNFASDVWNYLSATDAAGNFVNAPPRFRKWIADLQQNPTDPPGKFNAYAAYRDIFDTVYNSHGWGQTREPAAGVEGQAPTAESYSKDAGEAARIASLEHDARIASMEESGQIPGTPVSGADELRRGSATPSEDPGGPLEGEGPRLPRLRGSSLTASHLDPRTVGDAIEIAAANLGTTGRAIERAYFLAGGREGRWVDPITDSIEATVEVMRREGYRRNEALAAAQLVWGMPNNKQLAWLRLRVREWESGRTSKFNVESVRHALPEYVHQRILASLWEAGRPTELDLRAEGAVRRRALTGMLREARRGGRGGGVRVTREAAGGAADDMGREAVAQWLRAFKERTNTGRAKAAASVERAQQEASAALRREQARVRAELEKELSGHTRAANAAAERLNKITTEIQTRLDTIEKERRNAVRSGVTPGDRRRATRIIERNLSTIRKLEDEIVQLRKAVIRWPVLKADIERVLKLPPWPTGDPYRIARLQADIGAIENRVQNLQALLQDRSGLLRSYPGEIHLATQREALARLGLPSMTHDQFKTLPWNLRRFHVVEILSRADLQRHSSERYKTLLWYWESLSAEQQGAHPVIGSLVDSAQSGKFAGQATTRGLLASKPSMDKPPTIYTRTADVLNPNEPRIVLVDRLNGRSWSFYNYEQAAFFADELLASRRDAPVLDVPGTDLVGARPGARSVAPDSPPDRIFGGSDGEPFGLVPPAPRGGAFPAEPLPVRRRNGTAPTVEEIERATEWDVRTFDHQSLYQRYAQLAIHEMGRISRRVGELLGDPDFPLYKIFRSSLEGFKRYTTEWTQDWGPRIKKLMRESGIKWTRVTGAKLARAATDRGNIIYAMQRGDRKLGIEPATSEEILARMPEITEQVFRNHDLTDGERRFLIGMDTILTDFFRRVNIPEEYVYAYYPRIFNFSRGIQGAQGIKVAELMKDPISFVNAMKRTRVEALPEYLRMDPVVESVMKEMGISDFDDYFDTVSRYMRQGLRVAHMGDDLVDMQTLIGNGKIVSRTVEGRRVELGENVYSTLDSVYRRLMERMSASQRSAQSRRSARYKYWAEQVKTLEGNLSRMTVMKPVAQALNSFWRELGLKATYGETVSVLDLYTRLHRTAIFGLNPMRALRDSVSTSAFFLFPRFHTGDWAQGMRDVLFDAIADNDRWRSLLQRYRDEGRFNPDELFALERGDQLLSGRFQRYSEFASKLYRYNDIFTRVLAHRISELATERAVRAYRTGPNGVRGVWSEFLANTGLDTYDFMLDKATENEFRALLERGNITDLSKRVGSMHEAGAVFLYIKPNAPAYYDSAFGRFFGQYSVWPINAMNTLKGLSVSPYKFHSGTRAAMRSLEVATKFGLAAEGVYALGASLGVDTSRWIPFVHNTMGYAGGPGLTITQDFARLLNENPDLSRDWERNPWRVMGRMGKTAFPLVPDVFWKIASQTGALNEQTQRALGLPEPAHYPKERFLVGLGFSPFDPYLVSKAPRPRGIPSKIMSATVGQAQDVLSETIGVPPGTIKKAHRWRREFG